MSRLEQAQARLVAAVQRLDSALQAMETSARAATDSRDRQIAALVAELSVLRQDRDTLGSAADQAAARIDAVIDRLRGSLAN